MRSWIVYQVTQWLGLRRDKVGKANERDAHLSSNGHIGHFSLATIDKLRAFAIEKL